MKSALTRVLALIGLIIVLVAVNGGIFAKERIRANGQVIFLELAPVDPRSLMQGDYMALRFRIADGIPTEKSGRVALRIDARGVATVDPDPKSRGPRLRYRIRNGRVWLGTNAYFFEEGTAQRYANAKYGEFRLDRESGEAVLVGLRDEPVP
jgi:uncharacterized membrane-anchored protein